MAALVDDICNLPWPPSDLGMLEWRLQLLAEHTHEHFAAEEELMKARSYPNFQPHMLRHRAAGAAQHLADGACGTGPRLGSHEDDAPVARLADPASSTSATGHSPRTCT